MFVFQHFVHRKHIKKIRYYLGVIPKMIKYREKKLEEHKFIEILIFA